MKLQTAGALAAAVLVGYAARPATAPDVGTRFRVPDGFAVERVASGELTGSLIAMTFDAAGRLVVSKERGHPTVLLDRDGDGVFDTEQVFSDRVASAQGLWFDGPTLYAVAMGVEDKQAGLYRMTDTDGDGRANTFERVIRFRGDMNEHGPHALRRGPDGAPYLILGNHVWIPDELKDPASPLRGYDEDHLLPRYTDARGHAVDIMAPGGTVWRLDLERGLHVLVAGGFRNAYDHAFNLEGELFTFDSDMEWDLGLPWFREVRSVHVVPGGEYGWRTGSGKWPDYYVDSLPPLREVGRGSPVGVEFYQHDVYPERYRDAYLEGDWSRGRILASRLVRSGATYRLAEPSHDFVYGEPLNVTDLEVGPDGSVYFTTGGRNTEGGVYRVVFTGRRDAGASVAGARTGALAAVGQPQALSSWGHASLLRTREEMGERWETDLGQLATQPDAAPRDRIQAILLLQRFGPAPSPGMLERLMRDGATEVRAAAVYVAGQQRSAGARAVAVAALEDDDPFVRRRAAEALLRMGVGTDAGDLAPALLRLIGDQDRFVRYAARLVLERIEPARWRGAVLGTADPRAAVEGVLALVRLSRDDRDLAAPLERQIELLARADLDADDRLRLLRLLHITFIRLEAPLPPAVAQRVHDLVRARFPAAEDRLNTEYARTLAYVGRPDAIDLILAAMPQGDEDRRPLQIHYVYSLRAIEAGWTPARTGRLLDWFERSQHWRGGASFQGYINRLFDSVLDRLSEPERAAAYARFPLYAPLDEAEVQQRTRWQQQGARVFARRGWGSGLSEQELFEYLMYDPMTLRANADRGRAVYEKAACASCHRFGDLGFDAGPDLTTIASRFSRRDIIEATLWPSRTISDQYAGVEIATRDGSTYLGMVAGEDATHVHLQIAGVARTLAIAKDSIVSRTRSEVSTMPAGLLDDLNLEEIADLFAFLETGR